VKVPGAGYALYRIEKVNRPVAKADDPRRAAIKQQYARVLAEQDFGATSPRCASVTTSRLTTRCWTSRKTSKRWGRLQGAAGIFRAWRVIVGP
jgi:hypothetical protein